MANENSVSSTITVEIKPAGVEVLWPNQERHTFSWFWLRDHGEDDFSQDSNTKQRRIDTFSIPADIKANKVVVSDDGQFLQLDWIDNISTEISVKRLEEVASGASSSSSANAAVKTYWMQGSMLEQLPEISYAEIMDSDQGVLRWLGLIEQYGFAVVTDSVATENGTIELAKRIAPAQQTIFGTYWPLSAEIVEHKDTAYTTEFLSPHTDGSYYHNAAGLQMFNCIEFDGKGGESVVVDGFAIAEKMKQETPEYYETLCKVVVPAHYIEPGVHLKAERPAFRLNRFGQLAQLTFNNYDRSPLWLPDEEMSQFYAAYAEFNRHSMDQANWCKIPLRPGTALIFDNWRCMHGRMGYVGKRYFYGCYHNHAEYESRLRALTADTER